MTVPQEDLKRVYKLDDRQLEQAVRRQMDGASHEERRDLYKSVYDAKGKR